MCPDQSELYNLIWKPHLHNMDVFGNLAVNVRRGGPLFVWGSTLLVSASGSIAPVCKAPPESPFPPQCPLDLFAVSTFELN